MDEQFLRELHSKRDRIIYAKVIALDYEEHPIEAIEGRVTGGSINVDGASAVRRTCSISMVAQELNINEYYWGLRNKIQLEIGLQNNINSNYEDIIWFPQGIYILTGFNTTYSTNSWSISISGKDKMCMLNGDLGGNLTAAIDFGVEEWYDRITNIITYEKVPIRTIIQEMIHAQGGEPYHNIIINDLDERASELLEYRGDTPLYLLYRVGEEVYSNYYINGDIIVKVNGEDKKLSEVATRKGIAELSGAPTAEEQIFTLGDDETEYVCREIQYGEVVGYRPTTLTYAGDLISSIGESITSILDKIVKMLGAYEYFYDLEGRFVFQRKPNYIQSLWTGIKTDLESNEKYVTAEAYDSKFSFDFQDATLITSFQNNPVLNNLKNDYSIWGERKSVSGATLPIHYRYAIDDKPIKYYSLDISAEDVKGFDKLRPQTSVLYTTEDIEDEFVQVELEADQYRIGKFYVKNDDKYMLDPSNIYDEQTEYYYPQQMGNLDWREIIYQMALDYFQYSQLDNFLIKLEAQNVDEEELLYPSGYTGYEQYYTDIQGFWRQLYFPYTNSSEDFYLPDDVQVQTEKEPLWWSKDVLENPSGLNFWFDFLDTNSSLGQYSVKSIGDRTKVVNDTAVTSIYFREAPNLMFVTAEEYKDYDMDSEGAYTPVYINNSTNSLFSISARGLSAQDKLNDLLYQHSYCIENITISAIPIYYLEPNTRIRVYDENSGIDGEYIVSKISLPLSYNGTMSITANKAPEYIT